MGSQVAECSIYNHLAENRSDRRIVLFKAFVSLLVDCFPVLFLMKFKELLNIYVYSDSQGRYTRFSLGSLMTTGYNRSEAVTIEAGL